MASSTGSTDGQGSRAPAATISWEDEDQGAPGDARRFGSTSAHLAAAAFALSAFLLRYAFDPLLDSGNEFILFVLAVFCAAQLPGRSPAIFATVLSALFAMAIVPAAERFSSETIYQLCVFLLTSVAIVWLGRSRESERALARRLTQNVNRAHVLNEELRLLLDGAREYAIFLVDPQGTIISWNSGAERIYGWSEQEALGQHLSIFFNPGELSPVDAANADLARALAEDGFRSEVWQIRKDGSEFFGSVSLAPVRDTDATLRAFAKVVHDTTERRATERAIERREEHLKSILDTVPDAMVVIDEDGTVTSFSSAAQRLFGYSDLDVVGYNVSMLMPEPDRSRHDGYLRRYLETGQRHIIGIGRIVTGMRADGSTFPMKLSVGEAISSDQRVFTGFVQDLTERQAFETKLEQARSELIHVSRLSAMGTMASTLAHELNQPLTAIANYGSALGELLDSEDPMTREILRDGFAEMSEQAIRAGSIVRRLRQFVERGDLSKTVEDVPALINEAAALALVGTREQGISAQFFYSPVATPVFVDRVQIQQVLVNLMRNACEAMASSPVRRLSISTMLLDPETVQISVSDTGPGLDPEIEKRLFEAFASTKNNGMGLGLSICRTIIESHGGRISARPALSGGTEFQFTLPRPKELEGSA